jgi:TonB family protein
MGEKVHKTSPKEGKKNIDLTKLGHNALGEENPFQKASETAKIGQNTTPKKATVSASNDYIQEIPLGDFTHVNTTEFKFFGFYHRIRQKLEQFWGRSIQEKAAALHRAGRRLPASEDLITSLRITLDEKGQIVKVKVLSTSGVRELDDAAIESFNKAGPFPNPPKDLLVEGEATIEWGFVVKS